MTALIEELKLVPDEPPTTTADVPTCTVCGVELPYRGTGRRPTKCDEHNRRKRGGGKSAASSTAGGGSNEKLANQAVDVLCQVNEMVAVGAMLAKLFGTASAISERNDAFREQAYQALLLDPGLCKTILRGGAKSGKFALIGAYAMLAVGVVPVAIEEVKELRAARAAESSEEDEPA